MYTIADLKEYLDQLYDDTDPIDLEEHLTFEPVSLTFAKDVDNWGPDGDNNRIRICVKALTRKGTNHGTTED